MGQQQVKICQKLIIKTGTGTGTGLSRIIIGNGIYGINDKEQETTQLVKNTVNKSRNKMSANLGNCRYISADGLNC